MSMRRQKGNSSKSRLISEAARLFVEQALPDFHAAKRKARQTLHLASDTPLPSDAELEQAVRDYQRLFRRDAQVETLTEMREAAFALMKRLEKFTPKLTGSVLSGVADAHNVITLHLFADPPEAVDWLLMDRKVRFDTGERRLTLAGGITERLPVLRFEFRQWPVEAVVFSGRQGRHPPVTLGDLRPVERAGLRDVEALLMLSQDWDAHT